MKTTKNHFKIFIGECRKWILAFGLVDWKTVFYHEDWSESYGESLAWCKWDQDGRVCSICLNSNWQNEYFSEKILKTVAFHEVGHLLLGRLNNFAVERSATENDIDEEVHAIIRRLEFAVYDNKVRPLRKT